MPSNGAKTSPEAIAAAHRRAKAMELRLAGLSFKEIAAECGYAGKQGAYEAIRAGIKAITREPAEELLSLDLERLDQVFGVFYLNAKAGDLNALNGCLRVMERRARLLGLDAPVKSESKIEQQTAAGGVLVVPAMMDEASWLEAVKKSQAELAAKEAKVLASPTSGLGNKTRRRVED